MILRQNQKVRTHRSFKNYFTALGTTAVTLLTTLVATPFLLRWLGTEKFGAYRIVLDWLGYLTLLELGLVDAIIPSLARAVGKNDQGQVRAALISGFRALLRSAFVKFVVGILMAIWIGYLVPTKGDGISDVRFAFSIGIVSSLLCPLNPFRALLEAQQMGYRVSQLLGLQALISTAFALLFAKQGMGITGQMLALFLGGIVFYGLISVHALLGLPGLSKQLFTKHTDPSIWKEIWSLNLPLFISSFCIRISLLTDQIVIAFFMGPAAVTPFYLTQRLISLVQNQLNGIGNSTWAALAEIQIQGKNEILNKRMIELTRLVSTVGWIGLGTISIFNAPFVSLWVGASNYAGNWVTISASANALLMSLIYLWSWLFSATGLYPDLVRQYVVFAGFNFAASLFLTWKLGLAGPVLGTTISALSVPVLIIPQHLQKRFGIRAREIYWAIFYPSLILAPPVAFLWGAWSSRVPANWLELGSSMGLTSALLVTLAWKFVLNSEDRQLWKNRVKKIYEF